MKLLFSLLLISGVAIGAPKQKHKKPVPLKKELIQKKKQPKAIKRTPQNLKQETVGHGAIRYFECNGILSYRILYWNGQESIHNNRVSDKDRAYIEALLKKPEFIKENTIYRISKLKYQPIKPQEC